MKTELQEALEYDMIAEAEKLSGKSYKEDETVIWLGMALGKEQREKTDALLFLNRDTNSMRQTVEQFLDVLRDLEFAQVLEIPFAENDKFMVWWKPGLLVVLDTWRGKCVNSAKVYFNFKGPYESLRGCSHGAGTGTVHGNKDIRDGLREFLDREGEFVSPWISPPFLWLLHYEDTKIEGYSYEKINAERIAMLPEEVQRNIAGNTTADSN